MAIIKTKFCPIEVTVYFFFMNTKTYYHPLYSLTFKIKILYLLNNKFWIFEEANNQISIHMLTLHCIEAIFFKLYICFL